MTTEQWSIGNSRSWCSHGYPFSERIHPNFVSDKVNPPQDKNPPLIKRLTAWSGCFWGFFWEVGGGVTCGFQGFLAQYSRVAQRLISFILTGLNVFAGWCTVCLLAEKHKASQKLQPSVLFSCCCDPGVRTSVMVLWWKLFL